MKHYTYLIINLLSVIFPLVFSFHKKIEFVKVWPAFWKACLISASLFIIWDVYYTHLGVWGFNPDYVCGIYIGNLPLEECLFFICIPYSSVFTYYSLKKLKPITISKKIVNVLSILIISFLMLFSSVFHERLYTSVTFFVLSFFLIFILRRKDGWLGQFLIMYCIILIPFFIVNGILTGSFIDEPIVWYDDNQNMGIRIGTIPFEDIFYGMLLLLLNVFLYENFNKKSYN